jgi:hypothetical protein
MATDTGSGARTFRDHVRAHNTEHRADPAAVRRWAQPLLRDARHAGPLPAAGSTAWQALPTTDPRKLAAVIAAALAWLEESTPHAIATRAAADLDQIDAAILARQKAVSAAVSSALADAPAICYGPSYLELALRRAMPGPGHEPTPREAAQIARLTVAVRLFRDLLAGSDMAVRDAQRAALAATAPTVTEPRRSRKDTAA